jgi:glycosyltransferase involved in cell wall biosynthesis
VNLEGFQPAEGEPEKQDVPLLLSVGRLVEKKGFFHLLEALLLVKQRGVRFHCEIFGEGPLQGELEAWISNHGMAGEVNLAGSVTQEELIPIYQRAALFLLIPSVTEDGDRDGIPNSLAEAMAVGIPVITSAVGGIPELVSHGETGLIYEPGDASGIAAGITGLLAEEGRRRALGSAARRRVSEKFDIVQAAGSLQELFTRHTLQPAEVRETTALRQLV